MNDGKLVGREEELTVDGTQGNDGAEGALGTPGPDGDPITGVIDTEDSDGTQGDAGETGPLGTPGGDPIQGLREFPTLEAAMKDSFFYRIESAISEIFHIIEFLNENTSDTKTRSDMRRILNSALNNLLLIQEIITRSIREENLLLNAEEAAEEDAEEALEQVADTDTDIYADADVDADADTEE